jgi:hypothetical protein
MTLYEISNDNGVKVVNFATFKILTSKVQCSHIVTFINLLGHLLMETQSNLPYADRQETAFKCTYVQPFRAADVIMITIWWWQK